MKKKSALLQLLFVLIFPQNLVPDLFLCTIFFEWGGGRRHFVDRSIKQIFVCECNIVRPKTVISSTGSLLAVLRRFCCQVQFFSLCHLTIHYHCFNSNLWVVMSPAETEMIKINLLSEYYSSAHYVHIK